MLGEEPEAEVGRGRQDHDVGEGAERRPLPQGDPEEQDERPHETGQGAEAQAGALRQPLVQHAPGTEAQPGPHHERKAASVEGEPEEQLGQAPRRALTEGDVGERGRGRQRGR
ncbi:hypothetical protein JCM4914_07790 [Streptomyces platensis subsp. malvinus]